MTVWPLAKSLAAVEQLPWRPTSGERRAELRRAVREPAGRLYGDRAVIPPRPAPFHVSLS